MTPRTTIAACLAAAAATMAPLSAVAAETGGSTSSASQQSDRVLRVGSSGSAVKAVQRRLHVRTTGYYGSETAAAVKRFQRRRHLKADGVVGPATARALGVKLTSASYASGGAAPGSSSGSSGSSQPVRLPAALKRIAQCESSGNPRAISADGRYRGKFQFDMATWRSLGGRGDPAKAPESTQDRLALKLYRQRGTAPWANCA
jgi:peptidoglycan hydrolase-like protein with peptidoglycan-binding domain